MTVVVGALVAVLVVVGAVLLSRSNTSTASVGPTAAPTRSANATATTAAAAGAVALQPPPGGCTALEGKGVLRAGAPGLPVVLRSASYAVDRSTTPAGVSRAGQLTGTLPAGAHVWLLTYPRPDSVDSTPEHHPGSARLYPIGEITTTDGCWTLQPRALGYPEALGLTYDQYVVLADATASQDFADERINKKRDGFSLKELSIRAAPIIGIYAVPTTP
ncbi:MAG: hypothetical protein H0V92_08920 [Pseudonocardiales bacterium]|nr:hypothetical protein [Pseudonocardiales bacterium]